MAFLFDNDEQPAGVSAPVTPGLFTFGAPTQKPKNQPNPSAAVRGLLKDGVNPAPAKYANMVSHEPLCSPEAEQELCSALLRTDESNFKDMVLLAESFSIEDFFEIGRASCRERVCKYV